MLFSSMKNTLTQLSSFAALALFAFATQACNQIKVPETHLVSVALTRAWRGLEVGTPKINLTIHQVGGITATSGGFFHPISTIPVELKIAKEDGSVLAFFAAKDMNHTYQTIQIPGMGSDCTRDVDTFDGHNDDGTRIEGTVTSEYAMHYNGLQASNAWILKAEFDLSDSSGPLGHISASEYVDW
jgi:hypothetical protein